MEDKREPLCVRCPECGVEMEVDAATGLVLAHRAPRRATAPDLDRAAEQLARQERERERRFAQSVADERGRDERLARKFDHGLRRAREHPEEPRPVRDVDLD